MHNTTREYVSSIVCILEYSTLVVGMDTDYA